jgi:hypothetical protein
MRCPVCDKIIGDITPSHAKLHGFNSIKDFYEAFPEFERKSKKIKDVMDRRSARKFSEGLMKGVQV